MSKHDKMWNLHEKHTKEIALHPSKSLGLENILMSTAEANMFKPNTNDLYHQPDNILFDYNNWVIYNVEYKCHDTQKHKAVVQLHETARVLRTMFRNYDIVNLYVHDNYQIEEIQ